MVFDAIGENDSGIQVLELETYTLHPQHDPPLMIQNNLSASAAMLDVT
jgi:hypothetical protein